MVVVFCGTRAVLVTCLVFQLLLYLHGRGILNLFCIKFCGNPDHASLQSFCGPAHLRIVLHLVLLMFEQRGSRQPKV